MNKINLRISILCIVGLFFGSAVAQPSRATIDRFQSAVVRVESGNRVGSGFLWNDSKWVVTTLHLIADKNDIEITLSNDVQDAKVVRVLKEYDLVLLELVSSATALTVLSDINSNPELNLNLYTMGYNGRGNLNSIIDRTLRLGYNSNGKLEGLLPKKVKDALASCRRPSPDIEILYLDGSLLPGFSGSPIIDNTGRLVGIADGGLEEGASSISWGISANKLHVLVNSNEAFPNFISCDDSNVTFSAENLLDDQNVDHLEFGQFKFFKTKVRSVQQMMYTIDDPLGLQQLINLYSMDNNINYLQFKYDIYEDIYTGITFCVPEGTDLNVEGGLIMAEFPGTDFKYIAWPKTVTDTHPDPLYRYTPSALQFQQKIIDRDQGRLTYQQDFRLSYTTPIVRPDGITVNRVAYRGFSSYLNPYNQPVFVPETFSFQTHVAKGNIYFGAAALNEASTEQATNDLVSCINSGQCGRSDPGSVCAEICENYRLFSKLVIGVHM
ncbi:MAG: serine protease, partial [Prolixibacteraceae bacterium]